MLASVTKTTVTVAGVLYVLLGLGCSSSQVPKPTMEPEAAVPTETATNSPKIAPKSQECIRTLATLDLSAYWGSIPSQKQQRKFRAEYKKAGGRIRERLSPKETQRLIQAHPKDDHFWVGAEMGILARLEDGYVVPYSYCDGSLKCPLGLEVAGRSIHFEGIPERLHFDMTALADIDGDGGEEIVLRLGERGGLTSPDPESTNYIVIASVEPALLLLHRGGKECEELEIRTGSDSCLSGALVEIGCDANWTSYHRGEDGTYEPILTSATGR